MRSRSLPPSHHSVLARRRSRSARDPVSLVDRVLRERKPVLVVGSSLGLASATATRRAAALARILGARMVVVHAVDGPTPSSRIQTTATPDPKPRLRRLTRAVGEWCSVVLGHRVPEADVVVRPGRVVNVLAGVAKERKAILLVVGSESPDARRASFGLADRLVASTRKPVLVARPPTTSNRIVAATDLVDDTYPVLRRAASLGTRFEAPVTFVSNVPHDERAEPTGIDERRSLLEALARSMGGVDALLLGRRATAQAILEVAREQDADLVVVGMRDGLARPDERTTVETIVTEARRSVFVVPIGFRGSP